jgi:hypothetical protein
MIEAWTRLLRTAVRRWAGTISVGDPPWDALRRELDRWNAQAPALFWWRDDDAVAATPALERLLALRSDLGTPLALAVIPAHAEPSLAHAIAAQPQICVLPHGWNHADHAGPGQAASEFPAWRAPDQVGAELSRGFARLRTLFDGRCLPALVPPFNSVAPRFQGAIAGAGFRYVSAYRDFLGFPLPSRNVHVDVIDWQRHSAIPTAEAVRSLIAALRLRRYGLMPRSQPIGIMTHHLVHDEAVWTLTADLLRHLAAHPAVRFPSIETIFPPASAH